MTSRFALCALLVAAPVSHAGLVGSTAYSINCYATSPSPSIPFSDAARDTGAFSSSAYCLATDVPRSSGQSWVEVGQDSTVGEAGIASSGYVTHGKNGLWSGLGTSRIDVTLSPESDYQYEFLVASGYAETRLESGFITTKAGYLIQLSDLTAPEDLLRSTAAGTTGSLSGLLLAGHSYSFVAYADVLDSPLFNNASYDVNLALTAVPAPATAPLLLAALGALVLRRKERPSMDVR